MIARSDLRDAIAMMVASLTAEGSSEVAADPPQRSFAEVANLPIVYDPRFAWQTDEVEAVLDLERVLRDIGGHVCIMRRLQQVDAGRDWDARITTIGEFEQRLWDVMQTA